ncbi:hypothetical protein ABPG75_000188 [Micractinium tetrahymenae]
MCQGVSVCACRQQHPFLLVPTLLAAALTQLCGGRQCCALAGAADSDVKLWAGLDSSRCFNVAVDLADMAAAGPAAIAHSPPLFGMVDHLLCRIAEAGPGPRRSGPLRCSMCSRRHA